MATPPPTKPPRGVKYGKEEIGCGPLVTVIKTLGFSETHEERQKEKQKIEKEFKKSDQKLNELVSKYDGQLTKVLPLFSQVSTDIQVSREKIHAVKENLIACKKLLLCRRDELRALWIDSLQQKLSLEMFEQITELRKVPQQVNSYTNKRHYLHATKTLTQAIDLGNGPLREIEGLNDLRADLQRRKTQLYNKLIDELNRYLYHNATGEVLGNFQRQQSARGSKNFKRDLTRLSTDRSEANARIKQALVEMSQGFDLNKSEVINEDDLVDPDLSTNYFIGIIVECFAMLDQVPDSIEKIKVRIQPELTKIIENTTQEMITMDLTQIEPEQHPLLALLDVIFKQFKIIAKSHNLLLKSYLNVVQRYQLCSGSYDISDFWGQAQVALQLLLSDYLDITNDTAEENRSNFSEPAININSFFSRRKVQSKKTLFRFDKASHIVPIEESFVKEHRRNLSDVSNDDNLFNISSGARKKREKVLICPADASLIRKLYIPLKSYISEIEESIKCKPGQQSGLNTFVKGYIKDTFLSKGHNRNLQMTIDSLSKNHDAWRAIITPEDMKDLNLARPLLESTVLVERRLSETKTLVQDLPDFSDDLLKMVCALLKTYRETCQAAYRGIVQPDAEDKRIYSVAWLKDDDINRFLKTLPNWTDLKNSSTRAKSSRKLQKYEQSEEESPLQIQQRNIREAEMLTSNLGEGGISQQEILSDIGVLKELATLQESMEWFSSRISEFANDLRRPSVNAASSGSEYIIKDGTIKVLTNLALEFDELANTCLLVLHLEIRVQCFHYLRGASSKNQLRSFMSSKDVDSLEADSSVLKLTKILSEMDEAFSSALHPRKTRYIFEGLAHLAARILIQASNSMETIDEANIQRMCRNALALQQTLSSITATREVALDQARNFYELLCMSPDEILTSIIEKGSQFTEMQYLNALQLSAKSRGITDLNSLASFQQKLSDILGAKPTTGVVV